MTINGLIVPDYINYMSIHAAASVLILAIPWPGRGRSFPAAMLDGVATEAVETARAPLVTEPTQKRAGRYPGNVFRLHPISRTGRAVCGHIPAFSGRDIYRADPLACHRFPTPPLLCWPCALTRRRFRVFLGRLLSGSARVSPSGFGEYRPRRLTQLTRQCRCAPSKLLLSPAMR